MSKGASRGCDGELTAVDKGNIPICMGRKASRAPCSHGWRSQSIIPIRLNWNATEDEGEEGEYHEDDEEYYEI